ncbi:MAG: hypothetical protein ACOYXC_19990 [Candidatus Rifleibacteriota bacterium]
MAEEKKERIEKPEKPKVDLQAEHRKVIFIMIAVFVAIMVLMILMQNHVEFASTGGM